MHTVSILYLPPAVLSIQFRIDCSMESFIILTVLHICISVCFLCIDKTCLIEVYTTIFHIPSCTIMFHKTSVGKIYLTVIYRPPAAAIIAQCVVIIRIVKEGTMVYFPPAVFPVNGSLYQSVQITLQHSVPDIYIMVIYLYPSITGKIYLTVSDIPAIKFVSILIISFSNAGIGEINQSVISGIPPAAVIRIHQHFVLCLHSLKESIPVCLSIYCELVHTIDIRIHLAICDAAQNVSIVSGVIIIKSVKIEIDLSIFHIPVMVPVVILRDTQSVIIKIYQSVFRIDIPPATCI